MVINPAWRSAVAALSLILSSAAGCSQSPAESSDKSVSVSSVQPVKAATPELSIGDWPQWRGPNGDNVSTETEWTSDWPADGPKKQWTAEVGTGFSSLAIAGGRAYTMGRAAGPPGPGDKEKLGDDTVWCLDATTGKPIWKYTYPAKLVANLHEGGPAATPTVDGDHVYMLSKDGQLFCFDGAGHVVWKDELTKLLDVEMPGWGFSESPRVLGDKLIIEAGRTAALDKNSGKLIWQTEKYRPGYGSPTLIGMTSLGTLVAVVNNDFLMIIGTDDGHEVNRVKWETDYSTSAATPIISLDPFAFPDGVPVSSRAATIFISTGYHRGCAKFTLTNEPPKLAKVYENKNLSTHMATGALYKAVVYGIDGQSSNPSQCKLTALDFDSGKVLWQERGFGCGTLTIAGDRLIVLSDEGKLSIVEANPKEFKSLASAQVLEGKCWTPPVLAGGRIYCRNAAGQVVCLDVRK